MSVVILDSNGQQIKKFYQWDYNISIQIRCVEFDIDISPIDLTGIAMTNGGYINPDGTVRSASGSAYTGYIPVTPGQKIQLGGVYLDSVRSICAYDSSKHKVGDALNGINSDTVVFVVPPEGVYIRVTTQTTNSLTAGEITRAPDINFANGSCGAAISVTPAITTPGGVTTLTTVVPNSMLTTPEAMRIFFYTNIAASEYRTTYETTIPVMPRQIPADYPGGGAVSIVEIEPLTVDANGVFTARAGTAWSPIIVNVPSEDTGTVQISTNGIHDVTGYASADVDVPASEVDSGTKSISENGTHDVVGYATAQVDVPNSYAAGDEGKVVSNGTLAVQTPHATVVQNGTIDTTTNNSVEVAVPASAVDSGTKEITQNGIHDVVGYASAEVDVPNSYSSGDEGKVVHNGGLVSQTAHAKVVQNGTIDTTLNNSVQVAVPASAVDAGTKSISTNGTHDVIGYASAQVNVPNSYSSSDENKVVHNGSLVAQTAHSTVTNNGTVDTTLNNSVVVAVPASAVDSGTKQITTNGTHDVIGYASAQVAVPASAVDSGTKSITSNGTHDVVGYASASVNVPNSYTSSDEGKVVSNGALIAQVAHALVTANGVIDTTLNNSVEIAVPSGGIEFPSDWFVDSWTQASDSQSKTWTHGLGQQPNFVVCMCLDTDAGSNGRIMDFAVAKPDGTWVQSGVFSYNSSQSTVYGSQSIGYNGYDINATTITLTQGRYYSATFKQGKKYLLLAHK